MGGGGRPHVSPGPFPAPTASMTRARGARAESDKFEVVPPLLTRAARRARAARAGGRWPTSPVPSHGGKGGDNRWGGRRGLQRNSNAVSGRVREPLRLGDSESHRSPSIPRQRDGRDPLAPSPPRPLESRDRSGRARPSQPPYSMAPGRFRLPGGPRLLLGGTEIVLPAPPVPKGGDIFRAREGITARAARRELPQ